MSKTRTGKTTQVTIRIDDPVYARIAQLVSKFSKGDMKIPRSEVIRAALLKGVEKLEAEIVLEAARKKGIPS